MRVRRYLRAATGDCVPARAFLVAIVVAPVLILINQPAVIHDPAAHEPRMSRA